MTVMICSSTVDKDWQAIPALSCNYIHVKRTMNIIFLKTTDGLIRRGYLFIIKLIILICLHSCNRKNKILFAEISVLFQRRFTGCMRH